MVDGDGVVDGGELLDLGADLAAAAGLAADEPLGDRPQVVAAGLAQAAQAIDAGLKGRRAAGQVEHGAARGRGGGAGQP